MRLSIHLLVSVIISALLFPFYRLEVLLILLGGIFIDIDHYLIYLYRYKDINIFKAYNHFKKKSLDSFLGTLCLFHSLEVLVILVILSFFSRYILLITIGIVAHYILDLMFEYSAMKRLIKEWSLFRWLKKKNKTGN